MSTYFAARAGLRASEAAKDAASLAGQERIDDALMLVIEARSHLDTMEQNLRKAGRHAPLPARHSGRVIDPRENGQ